MSHQLPPAAQTALYWQPLKTLIEQLTPDLQTWYQWGQKYFNQQLKAAKKQASLHTPDIQTFFHPKTQHKPDLHPHPRKPCHTELVWVFFVHHSLREITLKMLSFFIGIFMHSLDHFIYSLDLFISQSRSFYSQSGPSFLKSGPFFVQPVLSFIYCVPFYLLVCIFKRNPYKASLLIMGTFIF